MVVYQEAIVVGDMARPLRIAIAEEQLFYFCSTLYWLEQRVIREYMIEKRALLGAGMLRTTVAVQSPRR